MEGTVALHFVIICSCLEVPAIIFVGVKAMRCLAHAAPHDVAAANALICAYRATPTYPTGAGLPYSSASPKRRCRRGWHWRKRRRCARPRCDRAQTSAPPRPTGKNKYLSNSCSRYSHRPAGSQLVRAEKQVQTEPD